MDDDARQPEIEWLLERLDALIPEEGGWLHFEPDNGDPHGGAVTGNRIGFQRVGLEFLRGGFAEPDQRRHLPVDISSLIDDSPIQFAYFVLSDKAVDPPPPTNRFLDRACLIGCALLLMGAVFVFAAGLSHIKEYLTPR